MSEYERAGVTTSGNCRIDEYSSRTCDRGTDGCENLTHHRDDWSRIQQAGEQLREQFGGGVVSLSEQLALAHEKIALLEIMIENRDRLISHHRTR